MALVDCEAPIFDRQVDEVLELLEQGVDRAEIAQRLGYKNPISVDNYMRRRNFSWDSRQQNFVPAQERYSGKGRDNLLTLRGVTKADMIINLFDQGESDAKDIAKQAGFDSHMDMAAYMKQKGYKWSSERGNYVLMSNDDKADTNGSHGQYGTNQTLAELLEKIVPIMQGGQGGSSGAANESDYAAKVKTLPRYAIKGKYGNKAMRMANVLDDLTILFSQERKITQREIMEIALIEFFKKYGYADQIEEILCG